MNGQATCSICKMNGRIFRAKARYRESCGCSEVLCPEHGIEFMQRFTCWVCGG